MIKDLLTSPFQKFIKTESLSGILLFGATIIALIWANSPFADSYQAIWSTKLGFLFEGFEINKSLLLWINDGLMAIFFFLIGLELKRELLIGEINTLKKAAFPFFAAVGGIIFPVGLFLLLNTDPQTTKGWGIPMATDIAFALAILKTLGNKVPLSLKIFLTAFAIIDDIAAVLVIALFYSNSINWLFIIIGIVLVLILAAGYYKKYHFGFGIALAVVVWFLFLKSGIHPTIAGVLLAFTIPIKKSIDIGFFTKNLQEIGEKIKAAQPNEKKHLLTKEEIENIDQLDQLIFEARSPLQHLEHQLHSLTAYFILPVFAFANAGVSISTSNPFNTDLLLHIAICLFFGKIFGISLLSYLGLKFKITQLPEGVKFKQIIGIASIAGVGFTMSIFIDNLAFADDLINLNSAKVGIIIGSLISGIVGYLILRFTAQKE